MCCCCIVQNCSPGWWEEDGRYQDGTAKAEPLTPIYPLRHPGPENEMMSAHEGRCTFSYLFRHLHSARIFFPHYMKLCRLISSAETFVFLKNLVPFPQKLPRINHVELSWGGTNKKKKKKNYQKLRNCNDVCVYLTTPGNFISAMRYSGTPTGGPTSKVTSGLKNDMNEGWIKS